MVDTVGVLVTGATRGIGRQLVIELTRRGQINGKSIVIYASGRDKELLSSLANETGCFFGNFDISNSDDVVKLYTDAKEKLGKVDILINNAGYSNKNKKQPLHETSLDDFEKQYAVNVRAPYILCRDALKDMVVRRSGQIINIISTAALRPNRDFAIYASTKHALKGLTQSLVAEAQPFNVLITGVYPGGTDTEIRDTPRPDYMSAQSVAVYICNAAIFVPPDVVPGSITFRPQVELL